MGTKGRDFIESVARIIPGYRGYSEKETRRDMDRLLRETIAKSIDAAENDLDAGVATCSQQGGFEHLEGLEALRRRATTEAERLRRAPGGYSGFFDSIQVEQPALERLHEHDQRLSEHVEAFAAACKVLENEIDADRIAAAREAMDRIEAHVSEREDVMKGVN